MVMYSPMSLPDSYKVYGDDIVIISPHGQLTKFTKLIQSSQALVLDSNLVQSVESSLLSV